MPAQAFAQPCEWMVKGRKSLKLIQLQTKKAGSCSESCGSGLMGNHMAGDLTDPLSMPIYFTVTYWAAAPWNSTTFYRRYHLWCSAFRELNERTLLCWPTFCNLGFLLVWIWWCLCHVTYPVENRRYKDVMLKEERLKSLEICSFYDATVVLLSSLVSFGVLKHGGETLNSVIWRDFVIWWYRKSLNEGWKARNSDRSPVIWYVCNQSIIIWEHDYSFRFPRGTGTVAVVVFVWSHLHHSHLCTPFCNLVTLTWNRRRIWDSFQASSYPSLPIFDSFQFLPAEGWWKNLYWSMAACVVRCCLCWF